MQDDTSTLLDQGSSIGILPIAEVLLASGEKKFAGGLSAKNSGDADLATRQLQGARSMLATVLSENTQSSIATKLRASSLIVDVNLALEESDRALDAALHGWELSKVEDQKTSRALVGNREADRRWDNRVGDVLEQRQYKTSERQFRAIERLGRDCPTFFAHLARLRLRVADELALREHKEAACELYSEVFWDLTRAGENPAALEAAEHLVNLATGIPAWETIAGSILARSRAQEAAALVKPSGLDRAHLG